MEDFLIRDLEKKDIPVLHGLISGLATHEKRPQDVTGTDKEMEYWLFERKIAKTLIAEYKGEAAGYALYYPVYGSFSARGKVHLEDIFIKPELRGKGLGTALLARVCRDILSQGYTGMEWSALDFNESAIKYYLNLGAEQESGRVYFDFAEKNIREIADKY